MILLSLAEYKVLNESNIMAIRIQNDRLGFILYYILFYFILLFIIR